MLNDRIEMKTSRIIQLILILLSLTVSGCCKYYDFQEQYLLTITNKSDQSITWIVPDKRIDGVGDSSVLPDILTETIEKEINENVIGPHSSVDIMVNDECRGTIFDNYLADDVVCFYFFDTATIRENSWEIVVTNKMWLKKMPMSASDVIEMKKEIVF